MNFNLHLAFFLCLQLASASVLWSKDQSELDHLTNELSAIAEQGGVVGLQVAVRNIDGLLLSRCYGKVAGGSTLPVNHETQFLIASCSKPLASACLLSLINDSEVALELDSEIDRLLPAFKSPAIKDGGTTVRSPTVEELMSHRAGIYSQKSGMTKQQARWIRDFSISLEQSVNGIAKYPLIAQPGKSYAYSGAGYCVLGRVAEEATGKPFETILQERLCQPLGLSRTTYFPWRNFPQNEIATGVSQQTSPHLLGEKHQLPLIGGSLYTTAEEMTRFGVGILEGWTGISSSLQLGIPKELVKELGKPRSPGSNYSLGWKVLKRNGKAIRLSHSGSLHSYRAWFAVDLEKELSIAGCWTLSGPARQPVITKHLQQYLDDNKVIRKSLER